MNDKPEKMIYEGVPKESPSEGKNIQERIDTLLEIQDRFARINKILDDARMARKNGSIK